MGCCGEKSMSKCCLCSQNSNEWFPWGEKRKICWRCEKKQHELIIEREKTNKRIKMLLAGKGE